jgi:predicted metal-dependent hydrolase
MSTWQSKEELKARVRYWENKLDIPTKSIAIRPMKKKWASWSTNGALTLNSDLLGFAREVTDYVIVHELLHFLVPNHGKLWKSLMRAHLGDYERLENKLAKASRQEIGFQAD